MTKVWMINKALVAALLLASVPCAAGAEIPQVLDSTQSGVGLPDWVAIEVAAPDGQVRPEWLPEHAIQDLERMLRTARSKKSPGAGAPLKPSTAQASSEAPACDVSQSRVVDYYVQDPTLEQVVAHSSTAVLGRMEESRTGFYRGVLAVLWRVRVAEVLKWPLDTAPPEEIYVIYGRALAEIEGLQLCMNITGASAPVVTGQEVFVASSAKPGSPASPLLDDGTPLLVPMAEEILVQQPDGSAAWGRRRLLWSEVLAKLEHVSTDSRGGERHEP